MSKEILEKSLEKTNELEEKLMKKVKIAEALGKITGSLVAVALDALIVWAILNYMVGFTVGFIPVLGGSLMFMVILAKIRSVL